MATWGRLTKGINRGIKKRRRLYWTFLIISLILLSISAMLWTYPPLERGNMDLWQNASSANSALGHTADILHYVLPDLFKGSITLAVIQKPEYLPILLTIILAFAGVRIILRSHIKKLCEASRKLVVTKWG
jgi:hypothetical protein